MKPGDLIKVGQEYHIAGKVYEHKVEYVDPYPDGYIGARRAICEVLPTKTVIYAGSNKNFQGKLAKGYKLPEEGWLVIIDGVLMEFFDNCWIEYVTGEDDDYNY